MRVTTVTPRGNVTGHRNRVTRDVELGAMVRASAGHRGPAPETVISAWTSIRLHKYDFPRGIPTVRRGTRDNGLYIENQRRR